MKFSSFYTTANNANSLSPFAKEGGEHFFYQQDRSSDQSEVAEEERPFSNGKTNAPWTGSDAYEQDMTPEEDMVTGNEKNSSTNGLAKEHEEPDLGAQPMMESFPSLVKKDHITELDRTAANSSNSLNLITGLQSPSLTTGAGLAGKEVTPISGSTDKTGADLFDLKLQAPGDLTGKTNALGKVAASTPALPGGKEIEKQVAGVDRSTKSIEAGNDTDKTEPTATASPSSEGATTDDGTKSPGSEPTSQAADQPTTSEADPGSSDGIDTNWEPGQENDQMDRINAGREVDFKPTIQGQAAIIESDSDITQQEIMQLASERRAQVSGLFAGSEANVTASIEGNALMVQELILNQQAAVMSVAVDAISNIQTLIAGATANAQALVQTYQAAIGSVVANATQTVQEGITGVASEITGLINSVNLPDLPGLQTARSIVVGLINNGAAAVNTTLTGMISMIGSMLQFGLGLLNGFIGLFGQLMGQAFTLVSNGIMTMLNLLISSFNTIMSIVISSLQNLLHAIILPLLSQIEGLVLRQIDKTEQEHLQQVVSNRDKHLEMLANILDPEGSSAGAAGAGGAGSGADPGWTIEKIGLSAVNNNQSLKNNFTKVVDLIFGNIVADITTALTRVITEINIRVNQFIAALIAMVTQVVQLIYSLLAVIIQFLTMIITELMNALNGLLSFITNAVSNPVSAAISAARNVLDRVRSAISNIVNNFLNGIGLGSSPSVSPPVVAPSYLGPAPAFAGGPIIIIGGKVIIIIGTAFVIISTTVAIIILVVLVIILLILLYLLYKWLTKPVPPPPPPPPPPPRGNEYSPGTPLVQEHAIPRRQRDIQVSKGEKMLFGFVGNDTDKVRPIGTPAWTDIPGQGPFEIEWEITGDADLFSQDSGIKGFTDPSRSSINLEVFVNNAWTGTPLSITATFRDNALPAAPPDIGTTKDPSDFIVEWTLKPRTNPCPQNLDRVAGADGSTWVKAPALYTYQGMPHLGPPGTPSYEGQTLLESFTTPTALNFTMDDLKPAWKAANPTLNTPDKVAAYLWNSGFNSTFVFNSRDQISDQHSGFGTVSPFLQSALDRPDGIGYRLPQIYSCDSNTIGTADIDRRISTANGIEVKKNGPS
ncbi:MAG: hypothetical protein J7578_16630 [Chitinophagaceae bacterium]|nr:hypothetical protein [Chitinophagaceae bacterium]